MRIKITNVILCNNYMLFLQLLFLEFMIIVQHSSSYYLKSAGPVLRRFTVLARLCTLTLGSDSEMAVLVFLLHKFNESDLV